MRCHILIWAFVAGLLPVDVVAAPYIALETPAGGCTLTLPVGGPAGTFHIVAHAEGLGDELTGAEFAVRGLPAGYLTVVTQNPAAAIAIGDPFGAGCNIAFSSCQTGTVVLYTVSLLNLSDTSGPATLHVERHDLPSGPSFMCPLITRCDNPVFTKQCVHGGALYLNPGPPVPPHDPFPVEGALGVATHPILSFDFSAPPVCDVHAAQELVYFGTEPDPPLVAYQFDRSCARPCWDPGVLEAFTTYYWRVVQTDAGGSPVWRFTTGNAVGVEHASWAGIKVLYR